MLTDAVGYGSGLKVASVMAVAWLGGVVCWWAGTFEKGAPDTLAGAPLAGGIMLADNKE